MTATAANEEVALLRDRLAQRLYSVDDAELIRLAAIILPEQFERAHEPSEASSIDLEELLPQLGMSRETFDSTIEEGRAAIARGEGVSLAEIRRRRTVSRDDK